MAALAADKDYPLDQSLRIRRVHFAAVTSGDTWTESALNTIEFALFFSETAQTSVPVIAINSQTRTVTLTLTNNGAAGTLILFGK